MRADGMRAVGRELTLLQYRLRDYDAGATVGRYNIPTLEKEEFIPPSLIGFNYVNKMKHTESGVHFFLDDYQFARIWTHLENYLPKLAEYACVLTPDFSLYMDMPLALKIYNIYRSRLVGQVLQKNGITVIPTLQFAEKETYDIAFDGIPKNGVVATSTIGVMRDKRAREVWESGMQEAIRRLKPACVLCYGSEQMAEKLKADTTVKHFSARRWEDGR